MAAATVPTLTAKETAPDAPPDHLDASLEDFAPSMGGSNHHRPVQQPNLPPQPFGYPSVHSGFRSDDTGSELGEGDSDSEASAGGYSPPAWRRLGNGDRSSGFWRKSDGLSGGLGGFAGGFEFDPAFNGSSRESSPEYESADEGEQVLAQAARTRLPRSMSPEKERSPEAEYYAARQYLPETVKVKEEEKVEFEFPEQNAMPKNCRFSNGSFFFFGSVLQLSPTLPTSPWPPDN